MIINKIDKPMLTLNKRIFSLAGSDKSFESLLGSPPSNTLLKDIEVFLSCELAAAGSIRPFFNSSRSSENSSSAKTSPEPFNALFRYRRQVSRSLTDTARIISNVRVFNFCNINNRGKLSIKFSRIYHNFPKFIRT